MYAFSKSSGVVDISTTLQTSSIVVRTKAVPRVEICEDIESLTSRRPS